MVAGGYRPDRCPPACAAGRKQTNGILSRMARKPHAAGRRATAVAALLLALLALAPGALAIEYRLQVVSVYEESFAALLRRGEFTYGALGPASIVSRPAWTGTSSPRVPSSTTV